MFLIMGSPRSGTTFLATTLSLHRSLHVIDQTDFIVPAAFILDRVADSNVGKKLIYDFICASRYFKNSIAPWLCPEEVKIIVKEAPYSLPHIIFDLYKKIGEKCGNKLCGDKSVADIGYYPILNRVGLFDGGIKIIHIVRDIRAVYASLERLGWIKDRQNYPRSWANANLGLLELLNGRSYYHFVRYEDLVLREREELEKICSFLGQDYDGNLENYHERGTFYRNDHFHSNLQKPSLKENVLKWKSELSKNLIDTCETQANEALRCFGYI